MACKTKCKVGLGFFEVEYIKCRVLVYTNGYPDSNYILTKDKYFDSCIMFTEHF